MILESGLDWKHMIYSKMWLRTHMESLSFTVTNSGFGNMNMNKYVNVCSSYKRQESSLVKFNRGFTFR